MKTDHEKTHPEKPVPEQSSPEVRARTRNRHDAVGAARGHVRHLSGKLIAIGIVIASLVTAFGSAPAERIVDVTVVPIATVLAEPHDAVLRRAELGPHGPQANPSFTLRATGYNSLVSQTNSQPFITATGARTEWGILAVSRDLLPRDIPYGSLVRIRDLGTFHHGRGYGKYQPILDGMLFRVEDTMHQRKQQQVDVWFEHLHEAVSWGVRRVEVEVVRYGRDGPMLDAFTPNGDVAMMPRLSARR